MRKRTIIVITLMLVIIVSLVAFYFVLPSGYMNSYVLNAGSNDVTFTQADIDACSSSHPTDVFSSIIDEVTYVMRYNGDTGLWDWNGYRDCVFQIYGIKA